MPTTYLADLIAAIRIDLHDTDAAAYRWTDTVLTRHIARALAEYNTASPLTATATINATVDVRAYALTATALTGRPDALFAVEWPYVSTAPTYPPNLVAFRIWGDTLNLLTPTAPAAGDVIRIWYHTTHTLSDASKTYDPGDDWLLQLGAAAYAALERESYAAERITIDAQTALDYQRWGDRALIRFHDELHFRRTNRAMAMDTRQAVDTSAI